MQVDGDFAKDGAACVRQALSPEVLDMARAAFDWSLANPGPGANELPGGDGTFYQDLANPQAFAAYATLLGQPVFRELLPPLLGTGSLWFMYEQVFRKSGAATRRTPWHQDTPYLPVAGDHLAVVWISFAPVARDHALEFVRGSHRGTLFDGSRFDPRDDTAPLYGDGSLPRLPDIEADRDAFEIVGWATQPGDVLVFHPSILHGGGATLAGSERCTLSLRFFGDDATVAQRPGARPGPMHQPDPAVHPLTRLRRGEPGAPFRDPAFPRIA